MMKKYRIYITVGKEGELPFELDFTVEAKDRKEVDRIFNDLLDLLSAGNVGGGVSEVSDDETGKLR
jgi:hypothetical protein